MPLTKKGKKIMKAMTKAYVRKVLGVELTRG